MAFYKTFDKRLTLIEGRRPPEPWIGLQLFDPIRGFRGIDAFFYRMTHLDELPLPERQWFSEEPDADKRQSILCELMVKTEDIRTRHKLLVEMIEAIPDAAEVLRELATLVPEDKVAGLQKRIELGERLFADYSNNDLDVRELLDVVHRNRDRLLELPHAAH